MSDPRNTARILVPRTEAMQEHFEWLHQRAPHNCGKGVHIGWAGTDLFPESPDDLVWAHDCFYGDRQAHRALGRIDVTSGTKHHISGSRELEHLTIEGSLLCSACQKHGFIRDGKWVEA